MILPERKYPSALSLEDWKQFFQAGYCIQREVFSSKELGEIRSAMNNLLEKARKLAEMPEIPENSEQKIEFEGSQFVLEKSNGQLKSLKRVSGCGSSEDDLLKASRKPELLKIFADLLLDKHMEQIICQFHPKKPHDEVGFAPHRDLEHRQNYDPSFRDINGFGSYVIALIAVDYANLENGGLTVVPKSHYTDFSPQIPKAVSNFDPQWHEYAITPELSPGDVLLMHPLIVHWSNPNQGSYSRMSLLSGMCSIGANKGEYPGQCTNKELFI